MTSQTLRELYLLATDSLSQAESYLYDLKIKQKHTEKRIEQYKRWKAESHNVICKACNGHGEIRHVYDQDDIKLEKCTECNGTGIKDYEMV